MRLSYYISAVELNNEQTRVSRVWVYQRVDGQPSLVYDGEMTRDQVISYLKSGFPFITMISRTDQFVMGTPVRVTRVNGEEYLRTTWTPQPVDDLGALPNSASLVHPAPMEQPRTI